MTDINRKNLKKLYVHMKRLLLMLPFFFMMACEPDNQVIDEAIEEPTVENTDNKEDFFGSTEDMIPENGNM